MFVGSGRVICWVRRSWSNVCSGPIFGVIYTVPSLPEEDGATCCGAVLHLPDCRRLHVWGCVSSVALLGLPLWLGWPCAAPPPSPLGVLRPLPFGIGAICDSFSFFTVEQPEMMHGLYIMHADHPLARCTAREGVIPLQQQKAFTNGFNHQNDLC